MPGRWPTLQIYYKDTGGLGWSEKLVWGDGAVNLADCVDDSNSLILARAACLGAGITVLGGRLSFDDVWRDSLLVRPWPFFREMAEGDAYNPGIEAATVKGPYEDSDLCFNLRGESLASNRRVVYLGGLPNAVVFEGRPMPENLAAFSTAYEAYKKHLLGKAGTEHKWGFKGEIMGNGQIEVDIKDVQRDANTRVKLLFKQAVPLTWAKNLTVVVRACKMKPGSQKLNGRWIIGDIGPDNIALSDSAALKIKWDSNGKVRLLDYKFFPFTSIILEGVSTRKRGLPFGTPRGRSLTQHTYRA